MLNDSSLLNIQGSGFGTAVGDVKFKNIGGANSYFEAPTNHIRYWSDTLIRVWVPSIGKIDNADLDKCAGSGKIKVVKAGGGTVNSTQVLSIPYALSNVYIEEVGKYRRVRLVGGTGVNTHGYTIVYDKPFFDNKPALNAFRRALQTWRCATGVNITELCGGKTVCNLPDYAAVLLIAA